MLLKRSTPQTTSVTNPLVMRTYAVWRPSSSSPLAYAKPSPTFEILIEDQIAEGDKVLTRFRSRGTHQGELWGIPPTGREVEITNMSMSRIEGGKMVEEWPAPDRLGMMQQLGVIDQPSG